MVHFPDEQFCIVLDGDSMQQHHFRWRPLVLLNIRTTSLHQFSRFREGTAMMKLVLLVALSFTFATASIAALISDPQPAVACDHDGR
jgi:hypothetical protein